MIQEHHIQSSVETETITFDFTQDVIEGETLAEESITISVFEEEDEAEEVEDIYVIDSAELTGNIVTAQVENIADGLIYIIRCTIESEDNTYTRTIRLIGRD